MQAIASSTWRLPRSAGASLAGAMFAVALALVVSYLVVSRRRVRAGERRARARPSMPRTSRLWRCPAEPCVHDGDDPPLRALLDAIVIGSSAPLRIEERTRHGWAELRRRPEPLERGKSRRVTRTRDSKRGMA
jgi:hypothetical protein